MTPNKKSKKTEQSSAEVIEDCKKTEQFSTEVIEDDYKKLEEINSHGHIPHFFDNLVQNPAKFLELLNKMIRTTLDETNRILNINIHDDINLDEDNDIILDLKQRYEINYRVHKLLEHIGNPNMCVDYIKAVKERTIIFKKLYRKNINKELCSICQDMLKNEPKNIMFFECGHIYHEKCIRSIKDCAVCRVKSCCKFSAFDVFADEIVIEYKLRI